MWNTATCNTNRARGSALLAVLWLSLALSAIAFSVANTVHGETERVSTAVDGIRSYYLATGAIEKGILYIEWGRGVPPSDELPYYFPNRPVLRMSFPSGEAEVEVIPETAKLDINTATPDDLMRLLMALGASDERAHGVVEAINDWRTPAPETQFDQYYLSLVPSFRSRHASFEEIEELLVLRGMTPELYYGSYERDGSGQLIRRGGLNECVSIFGATDRFDVNTARPALLSSVGLTDGQVQAIVERRRTQPFGPNSDFGAMGSGRLRVGGNSIFTLRATSRVRLQNGQLSDLRRTVAATVKFMPFGTQPSYQVLRWYDSPSRN